LNNVHEKKKEKSTLNLYQVNSCKVCVSLVSILSLTFTVRLCLTSEQLQPSSWRIFVKSSFFNCK